MSDLVEADVGKSNALIEASYRLNLHELRIILCCIAKLRREQISIEAAKTQFVDISLPEVRELIGTHSKSTYTELSDALETLFERQVTLYRESNTGLPLEQPIRTRWIQSTRRYDPIKQTISLMFSAPILPYLIELSEKYTQYHLVEAVRLKTVPAMRIFEMLHQWGKLQKVEIDIDSLRTRLSLNQDEAGKPQKKYTSWRELRRCVIDPSIEQINEKTTMNVRYEPVRVGRRYTKLKFTFSYKKLEKTDSTNTKKKEEEDKIPEATPQSPIDNKNDVLDYQVGGIQLRTIMNMARPRPNADFSLLAHVEKTVGGSQKVTPADREFITLHEAELMQLVF